MSPGGSEWFTAHNIRNERQRWTNKLPWDVNPREGSRMDDSTGQEILWLMTRERHLYDLGGFTRTCTD